MSAILLIITDCFSILIVCFGFCRGKLIRTLADASSAEQKGFSILQNVLNILGFVATVVTTVLITKYAKRQLEVMKKEEEALLLQ